MARLIALTIFALSLPAVAAEPKLPISSGRYEFQHKFAEQPEMHNEPVTVVIKGHHITIINEGPSGTFPHGIIGDGTLMWHSKSKQWILGYRKSDREVEDVGGCSDGPEVVDLKNRIFWTC